MPDDNRQPAASTQETPPDRTSIEAVLGTLYVLGQGPPKGFTDKLKSVRGPNDPEAFYLVATYCFDLMRRLEYLIKVARPFFEHVPPELSVRFMLDSQAINAPDTWKGRAEAAEKVMLDLLKESSDAGV
jgi:hypothetical protein